MALTKFLGVCSVDDDLFTIWNVTNPLAPTLVGTGGPGSGAQFNTCQYPVKVGDNMVVFNLTVNEVECLINITNRAAPVFVDNVAGSPTNVEIRRPITDGVRVYGFSRTADFFVIYTPNLAGAPGSEITRVTLAVGGEIDGVNNLRFSAGGTLVYGASTDDAAIEIIDISNPAAPSRVGKVTVTGAGNCVGLERVGNYLFLSDSVAGTIFVVDASTEASPNGTPVESLTHASLVGVNVLKASANGTILYACGTGSGFVVLDISNPLVISILGSVALPGTSNLDMQVGHGGMVFVSGGTDDSVQFIDVSVPTAPAIVNELNATSGSGSVDLARGLTYWTEGSDVGPVAPTVEDVDVQNATSGIVYGSAYASNETPAPDHTASRYRIARQSAPTTYLIDEIIEEPVIEFGFAGLPHNEDFQVQIAYRDENDVWSEWSGVFPFSTPDTDSPEQPTIALDYSIPEEAGIRVTTPIPPAHENPATEIVGARWQVDFTSGAFAALELDDIASEPNGPFSLLELILSDLGFSDTIWVRMAWVDEIGIQGPWSNTVAFTSAAEPTDAPASPTITLVEIEDLFHARFASSAYSSPVGSPQAASQWQLSINNQWNAPLENVVTTVPGEWTSYTYENVMPGFPNRARKRDRDAAGRWGTWSAPVTFTPWYTPFSPFITSHKQGDILSGVETLEWVRRPDDPTISVFTLEYSIDHGVSWERLFEDLFALEYEWDLSDLPDLTALLVRMWWKNPNTGQLSRPSSYAFRLENETEFTTIADLLDDDLWSRVWMEHESGFVVPPGTTHRRGFANRVQTTIGSNNPWQQGNLGFAYDPLLEPDGADIIAQIRWGSGDPGASFAEDGLKYLPRMDQWAGVALMAHGTVEDTGEPYEDRDYVGVGGIRLTLRPLEAPWPGGFKPCGWFPNRKCGIWAPFERQQRGTATAQLTLDVWQEAAEIPYYRNNLTLPESLGIEFVEVYQNYFDMDCLPHFLICEQRDTPTDNCERCNDPFNQSMPYAIRLRVETLQIHSGGNRDFRLRAAVYGPSIPFPAAGWHIDVTLLDVPMECGVCSFAMSALQWYGFAFNDFENLSVIPLSYGDCEAPSSEPIPEPETPDFVCPPIDPLPLALALGSRTGGQVYLAEQSSAEENLTLEMDLLSAPLAPSGQGGEAVYPNLYPVFETRGQAHVVVTPYIDGEPREECALEFDIDHTAAPHVRRYEVSLMAPWPVDDPILTAALRGTWIQVRIQAYSRECEIDLTLHGVEVETEKVRESAPNRTYLVMNEVVSFPDSRPIKLVLGEREGGGIFEAELGSDDDGAAFQGRVQSAPLAPEGVGGESVFTNLYITLTRRNTSTVTMTVTPIVDEVAQEVRTLSLAGVGVGQLRETIEVSLFEKFSLDSTERGTYVQRGVWFQVKLEITDTDAPDLVTIDGVELEVEKVRESEEHAN